jgi:hypothetical protein
MLQVTWRIVKEEKEVRYLTETYMLCYDIPGEGHILCTGMYKWQAEWLLEVLQNRVDYPVPERVER